MKRAGQKRRCAFTLIELLVVIAIIALLMAVILPALRKAKEQAIKLVDATQLKDIAMSFNFYTMDNHNKLPTSYMSDPVTGEYARWFTKVAPYYENVQHAIELAKKGAITSEEYWKRLYDDFFRCKTQVKKYPDDATGTYGYNAYLSFYRYDGTKTGDANMYNWRRVTDIVLPSNLPVMGCLNGDGGGGIIMQASGPHPSAVNYGFQETFLLRSTAWGPAPNHNGKCNFFFADYHVETRDVCKADAWPWYGNGNGILFHPKGWSYSKAKQAAQNGSPGWEP